MGEGKDDRIEATNIMKKPFRDLIDRRKVPKDDFCDALHYSMEGFDRWAEPCPGLDSNIIDVEHREVKEQKRIGNELNKDAYEATKMLLPNLPDNEIVFFEEKPWVGQKCDYVVFDELADLDKSIYEECLETAATLLSIPSLDSFGQGKFEIDLSQFEETPEKKHRDNYDRIFRSNGIDSSATTCNDKPNDK